MRAPPVNGAIARQPGLVADAAQAIETYAARASGRCHALATTADLSVAESASSALLSGMATIGAVRGMIMGDRDPAAALAQARRDHLKAYVAGPQGTTPWWHWPVFGVGVGVIAAASLLPGVFASILIALAMAVIAGGMSRIRIARHGAAPRFRGMPAPLRGLLVGFWAVTALLVGGAAMIAQIVNDPLWQYLILVTLTAVIVGVGGWHTERRYLAEARRLADAAGIDT